MPTALVIRAAGTNCEAEMVRAFERAGAEVRLEHVDRLIAAPDVISQCELIGFPGGFSYGDDIASGRIFAVKLRERLYPALRDAARRGVLMIGACNGFQVLVQVGLLPGPSQAESGNGLDHGPLLKWPDSQAPAQTTSLSFNTSGRFVDRWIGVKPEPRSVCVWTRGIAEAFGEHGRDALQLPIAHGEGRFVTASPSVLRQLEGHGQVAVRYRSNPNGSEADIAGICDRTGRIFGLMPHPERFLDWTLHPYWTRLSGELRSGPTPGLMMFQNAVRAAQEMRGRAVGLVTAGARAAAAAV